MVRESIKAAELVVIKAGSRVLLEQGGKPNYSQIAHLVEQIAALHKSKRKVIFVTSGAIGAGIEALGFKSRPKDLRSLQAAAAVGQVRLIRAYEDLFASHGCMIAQILLTHDDLNNRHRHLNIKRTLDALLERGIIPVINENDTVSTEEIKFGDNDVLASLVAMILEAKVLIFLTTAEGFMIQNSGSKKERLDHIIELDEDVLSHIESHKDGLSKGGMKSKLIAASKMIHVGGLAVIAPGTHKDSIKRIFEGENIGTVVGNVSKDSTQKMPGRKRWIAFYQKAKGMLVVDDGAKAALTLKGKSLLPVGVLKVSGKFLKGEVVEVRDLSGINFAKGISQMSSEEINNKINESGEKNSIEVVHRDDLVILDGEI